MNSAAQLIGTILRHDNKRSTYKLALIRSINDVVLSYPDLRLGDGGVAIPLRRLAEYWIAYYWPFVNRASPVLQGWTRTTGYGERASDIRFRPALTSLRESWERDHGVSRPSDGFLLVAELRNPRTAKSYSPELLERFRQATDDIVKSLEQPIQYSRAGNATYTVFSKPRLAREWNEAIMIPGASTDDKCVLIRSELWDSFRELSLWIEALCIDQWSRFTETVDETLDRGDAYNLLTSRIDNRMPLTWERNQIDILMRQGQIFRCPWTDKTLALGSYDIDHIVPVSIYPTNELWNLVPSNSDFNKHKKRARMPTPERMAKAEPILDEIYSAYQRSDALRVALHYDLEFRFDLESSPSSKSIARSVSRTTLAIADARSAERF